MLKTIFSLRSKSSFQLNKVDNVTGQFLRKFKESQIFPTPFNVTCVGFSSRPKDSDNLSVDLAFKEYGDEYLSPQTTPIIIMHGLLGSKNNWHSLANRLTKDVNNRMVITIDARNHGASPHTDGFNYELMVQDLVRFLNSRKIEKATFIGHSMGGRTTMLLALMYPEFVQDLVVVDISPVSHSATMLVEMPKLLYIIKNLPLDKDLTLNAARRQAVEEFKYYGLDEKLISFLMTNMEENNKRNWRWKFNIESISKNFKEISRLPNIGSPYQGRTLFIGGRKSDYLKPTDENEIKQLFPRAEFSYIEDAAHWVHAEKPAEFLLTVTEFLLTNSE